MLSGRNWRTVGKHESGIHYTGNQERDFKIESGITSARRREDESQGTAEDVSGWAKKNRGSAEKKVGEDQGRQDVKPKVVRIEVRTPCHLDKTPIS
jgi:hypothetical protein